MCQLWPSVVGMADVLVNCGLELKLNRETLPLTGVNKQHGICPKGTP